MSHKTSGLGPPPSYDGSQAPGTLPPYQEALYPELPSSSNEFHEQYIRPGMMGCRVRVLPTPPTFLPPPPQKRPVEKPKQPPPAVETSGDFEWVPATTSTASLLADRAVVGGYGGNGGPLWVIRAKYNGYLIPGKFAVSTNIASYGYRNKEVFVKQFEVLCARPENLQWVPATRGDVPRNAVFGGKSMLGTVLYVGRVSFQQTVTPGYVHPRNKGCYIGFGGSTVSLQTYEVLCRIR